MKQKKKATRKVINTIQEGANNYCNFQNWVLITHEVDLVCFMDAHVHQTMHG